MSENRDLDAQVTLARDDLRRLADAVRACWDIDLDRVRRAPVEELAPWEHQPGYEAAAHPNLRRPNVQAVHGHQGSGIVQRAPWTQPGRHSVERAYVEATRELARAHYELMTRTEWGDADPATDGAVWLPGRVVYVVNLSKRKRPLEAIPADQARVVPPDEMRRAIEGLSLGLEWARREHREGNLMLPERLGVLESCDHARAALKRIPEGLRRPEPRDCEHCGRRHGGEGKWCDWCSRCHRHGGSCRVCGEVAA